MGMLVLNRKEGEKLMIGENIVLTVVGIDHKRGIIRLGIDAPRDIPIERSEVRRRNQQQTAREQADDRTRPSADGSGAEVRPDEPE